MKKKLFSSIGGGLTLALLLATGLIGGPGSGALAQSADGPPGQSGIGAFRGDNLEVRVRAGFGSVAASPFSSGWIPFRISVSNQGPPISGKLVVQCRMDDNPSPQMREYVRPVQIATGSDQLFEIPAYLSNDEDAHVILIGSDGVVARIPINVDRSNWSNLEIVVVDTDSAALSGINQTLVTRAPNRPPFGRRPPGMESDPEPPQAALTAQQRQRGGAFRYPPQNYNVHPSVISADDLPRDFISYDQVEAVVLGDAPLSGLSQEQSRALRLWVASGGLLIVTGGADFSGLRASGLAELLPVQVKGTVTSPPSVTDLNSVYGPFETNEPALAMGAAIENSARVLIGNAEDVSVAERNYGSGIVRFLGMNPKLNPYRGWIGERELWADLLLPAAEARPRHSNWVTSGSRGNSGSSRFGAQGLLFRLAEIAPPSPGYILLFLISYVLCVGPINYAVLKWKRRTDLAWITIPAVVIAFTIVSVAVAHKSRGGSSILADASLVDLHQPERLAKTTSGLLIVPASKGTQELSFEGGDSFANDVRDSSPSSSASASGTLEGERRPDAFTLRLPMTTWATALLQVRSVNENAEALVQVEAGPDDPDDASATVLTLSNRSDVAITKAVYIDKDGISEPFDVRPGGVHRIELLAPQPGTFTAWYTTRLVESRDEADLFQEIAPILDKETGGQEVFTNGFFDKQSLPDACKQLTRPIIVCFVEKESTAISLDSGFKRRSKALYVIHL